MSIKSTRTVSRTRAMSMLMAEIPYLTNAALADALDAIADTGESRHLSICDNFDVTDDPDAAVDDRFFPYEY